MTQDRPVFKAGDIGELINALPCMFGFPPDDSLVVLGMQGPRIGFGMRLDLADVGRGASGIAKTASLAVGHLEHQRVEGAIVLAIGEPLALGRRLVAAVESRLVRVRPVAGGWATDERYWVSMAGGDPNGYAYRRSLDHPAAVQAVVEGQEISPSRRAVAVAMEPIEGPRRAALEVTAERVLTEIVSGAGPDLLSERGVATCVAVDVVPVLKDLLDDKHVADERLLRMGFLMTRIRIRDAAWDLITRDSARDLARVWLHVARHVPLEWAPPAFCLAAFAAWMTGDGARAVMAVEQALRIDREYSMAHLMVDLAMSGIDPRDWPGGTAQFVAQRRAWGSAAS
jgi:hypothetical protein